MVRFAAAAVILVAGVVPAQTLVGIKTVGSVFRLERSTGTTYRAGTVVGLGNAIVQELAFDPASRTAWLTTSTDQLWTVDLATGSTTLVGTYTPGGMNGLEWDGTRSLLYGVAANNRLYTIDPVTAATTLVGATGLSGTVNIAYDSTRDELLAVDSATISLHRLDRTFGLASTISAFNGPGSPGSLAYDAAADTLFLADGLTRNLYRVNPATGMANLVGPYGGLVVTATAVLPAADSVRRPHGCGVTLRVDGLPLLGDSLAAEVPNPAYPTFIGLGLRSLTIPFCACTLGHGWIASRLSDSAMLPIPNTVTFRGVQVAFQAGQVLTPFGCATPQIAFSDTFVFVID